MLEPYEIAMGAPPALRSAWVLEEITRHPLLFTKRIAT